MRHQVKKVKLSRSKGARRALLRNLAAAVILEGKIRTTLAKAKAVKPFVERLVSIAKKNNFSAQRRALAVLPNKKAVEKLFFDLRPKFASRNSGFVRIVNLGFRKGDSAKMALLELIQEAKENTKSEVKPESKEEGQSKKEEPKITKEKKKTKDEKKKERKK